MALDSEEFKRRRQEKAALRRKRLRQQRKIMIACLIAAGVLLVLGGIVFAISRGVGGKQPTEPTQPLSTGSTAPTQTDPAETEDSDLAVMHFLAAGDLNITDQVVAAGGENFEYGEVFKDVLPVLAGADLTTVNFEGNACGEPYGSATVSAPNSLLKALSNAGVDMLQMANSRSIYNGMPGLATTLRNIRQAGMEPIGAWEDRADFDAHQGYSIYEVNGIRVGVIAFTKGMDGMALPDGYGLCVNLMYNDYASTYQSVYKARLEWLMAEVDQESPDIVIVLVHWGSEYNDTQSKTQKEIRNILINNGANAIIGTHPHYVQAIERDPSGTVVAWSLGDFLGDAEKAGTEYSVLLDLEITKNTVTGDTYISDYNYIPIYTVKEADGRMRVVRLREAITAYENREIGCVSTEVYTSMVAALEKIESRVNPKE